MNARVAIEAGDLTLAKIACDYAMETARILGFASLLFEVRAMYSSAPPFSTYLAMPEKNISSCSLQGRCGWSRRARRI